MVCEIDEVAGELPAAINLASHQKSTLELTSQKQNATCIQQVTPVELPRHMSKVSCHQVKFAI